LLSFVFFTFAKHFNNEHRNPHAATMSGVHGQALSHIVRRGVQHLSGVGPEVIQKLQQDAQLYEQAGPEGEVSPMEFLPIIITGIFVTLLITSVSASLLPRNRKHVC